MIPSASTARSQAVGWSLLLLLLLGGAANGQTPIFLGTGSYTVPNAAYGVPGGDWHYSDPPVARHPVMIPNVGVFYVRNQRDLKYLQDNLLKHGVSVQPAQPVQPRCCGGACIVPKKIP